MRSPGSFWRDGIGWLWLALAVLVALAHRWVPDAVWLMVHLVVLGALTHAILVWSRHFTLALVRARPDAAAERRHRVRLYLQTAGAAGVLASVPFAYWHVTATFAVLVAVAVLWHGAEMWLLLRRSLPGRFRVTIWYYLTAALCLPVGATFGVLLAAGPDATWFPRLLVAHIGAMLLGWVLLTVVGTLLTFWPTLLRARMNPGAEALARQAYPWLVAGVALTVAAALLGDPAGVGIALAVYAFGLVWWGRGLVAPLLRRVPREFAPVSVGAALCWLVVALLWLAVMMLAHGWHAFEAGIGDLAAVIVVGFAAQLLTGALSYLIPSVGGGGASVVRAGQREFNRFAASRLVIINLGLAVWLAPIGAWARVTVSVLVLGALAAYLPLAWRGFRAAAAKRAELAAGEARPPAPAEGDRPVWTRRGLLGGAGAVAGALVCGIAIDPPAVGLPDWPQRRAPVTPSGRTTVVEVYTQDMRFHPDTVEVSMGDMLRVVVTNRDRVDSHDLRIGNAQTPRVDPGRTQSLEYGPVGESIQGYCTIVGHRQLGMVFDVVVV